jgi:hypothetical protein
MGDRRLKDSGGAEGRPPLQNAQGNHEKKPAKKISFIQ